MKLSRREVTKILLAAAVAPPGLAANAPSQVAGAKTWDVAVIGAGVFGAWSAYWLRKAGLCVILLDAYGAANSRASSGGESRIIRAAYGEDDFYSRWALRSLPQWKELAARCGQEIFHETGVLSFSDGSTDFVAQSERSLERLELERLGIMHEQLGAAELAKRFPQIGFKGNEVGILEPHSGTLMARRGVQVLVEELVRQGLDYQVAAATPPSSKGRLSSITTTGNETISAGVFVFACGPWLPKIFPELLGRYIQPERAEVYFLGVAPGDTRFTSPQMPTWI
jgi:sarcosine oxidase